MEPASAGGYTALVIRLGVGGDGTWCVEFDDTRQSRVLPLTPAILVVRLWHAGNTGVVRGTIRLHGSEHWGPIQSNVQPAELMHAWLTGEDGQTAP